MQAVAAFYAGFALFMLAGSLIALAVMLFQPLSVRLHKGRPHRVPATELPAHPRPAAHGPARRAA